MRWFSSGAAVERRLAMRRARRLRQALALYGFNDGDGLPSDAELDRERDTALVELLRDYRLLFGTPKWRWLETAVTAAATAESRRVSEAGGAGFYARDRLHKPDGHAPDGDDSVD
jgi:hypothetical protein